MNFADHQNNPVNRKPSNADKDQTALRSLIQKAWVARNSMRKINTEVKNSALKAISLALEKQSDSIFAANMKDLHANPHLAEPLRKRLKFNNAKLDEVQQSIASLINIDDPVNQVLESRELAENLQLYKIRCPIGLIAAIFESRPDAAVQIACLALKSSNAIILKGGSESSATVKVLSEIMHNTARSVGLPESWLISLQNRAEVHRLFELDDLVDLVIPRGSKDFVRYIMEHSKIPVLGHADGICHVFVDADADISMAINIIIDSKTQYPAVCNALETLLIHEKIAEKLIPLLFTKLIEKHVEIRCCAKSQEIFGKVQTTQSEYSNSPKLAKDSDWETEYLDNILSIRVVHSLEEATEHINNFGSGHSDGIVTSNQEHARIFMDSIDSANIMWNCSTRFSDGYRYGLGAEVGISTGKLHARGPMGLKDLTTIQWRIFGRGNTLAQFGEEARFRHQDIEPETYPFKSIR